MTAFKQFGTTCFFVLLFCSSLPALADDCDGIRQQLAALPASGGEVFVPAGLYNCGAPIVLDRSNVSLRGAGQELVTIRLADQIHAPLLIIGSPKTVVNSKGEYVTEHRVNDIHVSGITFDGNRSNHDPRKECGENTCDGDPSAVRNNGISIRGASHILVENVTTHSVISGGLVTEKHCDHLVVRDFNSYDNYFDGLAGYETEQSEFYNMYLHHNRGAGISIDINFNNNIVRDSRLHDNGDVGIFARNLHGNQFNSLSIERSGNHGLFFASVDGPSSCARDNQFNDLNVHGSRRAGFRLNNNCPGNRITGASDLCNNTEGGYSEEISGFLNFAPGVKCGPAVRTNPLPGKASAPEGPEVLKNWLNSEAGIALSLMKKNISPSGAVQGIIIASPSRQDPDYYFHWVRDSALVVDSLLMPATKNARNARMAPAELARTFNDFLTLSRRLQLAPTLTGLGEPRFNIDGTGYAWDWARPQNDGPALRTLTLFHGLDQLAIPKNSPEDQLLQLVVAADLRYLIDHFKDPSYDLWEEIKGDHFYTRLVQLAAIEEGQKHFRAEWKIGIQELTATATQLRALLDQHWRADAAYFRVSLNRIQGGETYKITDLDTAVILGALHANLDSPNFSVRDERILATATRLENAFLYAYQLNDGTMSIPYVTAPAIGRYVDDVYFGGNPWYITTAAFAELHYRLAASLAAQSSYMVSELNFNFLQSALVLHGTPAEIGRLKIGLDLSNDKALLKTLQESLKVKGDLFMARIRFQTPTDGSMSEQFGRALGQPLSAKDLTWSYASFLSAYKTRQKLVP